MKCEGKVALVTGAAGNGLGRSIALTLAREGAHVVVNYRTSAASAQAIVDHIQGSGGQAIVAPADVFTAEGCESLVGATLQAFGQLDICIIGPGGGWHAEGIDQLDPEAALEDIHHETAPLLYLLPRILPAMYAQRWGRIIGIASHPGKLSPAYAYNTGKAARIQALLLAQDQAWAHGVTLNVIAPGPLSGLPDLPTAIDHAQLGPTWLQRANISPQDIAEGVAFLCSEAGRYISGCVLPYLWS